MANEIRTRTNFVAGLVEDNPLTNVSTTLTSAGLASLPVIDTTNHAAIIIDPDGVSGAQEIAWVTAHTVASTTATILRAQEGTSARQHERDTPWVHSSTALDFSRGGVEDVGGSTETTTSTSYTDLASVGPTVQFVAPASGIVTILMSTRIWNSGNDPSWMGVEVIRVSDSLVIRAPNDGDLMVVGGSGAWGGPAMACIANIPGLMPGTIYQARAKYKVAAGTGSYMQRRLAVIPLG